MAKVLITESILQDTADAIRSKSGSQDTMTPSEFADNIDDLQVVNLSDYFANTISDGTNNSPGLNKMIKTIPSDTTVSGTNLSYAFYDSGITSIPLIDTSNVTNMKSIFMYCRNLTEVPQLNTSKVTDMEYMFYYCTSLTNVPLLDTSNATNLHGIFGQCSSLTSIPPIDTSNATNIGNIVSGCTALVTLPQLDASKATTMSYMFRDCTNLSNESLNNILGMCIGATSFTGDKTLYYIFGFSNMSHYYPASTIQGLSNYQAFIDAGWTIGW